MDIIDDLKKGFDIMLGPSRHIPKSGGIAGTLKFYYKATFIPLLLAVVFAYFLHPTFPGFGMMNGYYALASFTLSMYLILLVIGVWVIIPVSSAVNAFVYHVVGKFFLNVWKGKYDATFNATLLSALPFALLVFLLPIPGIRALYLFFAVFWHMILLTIALAVLQKVKRMEALFALFTTCVAALLAFATAVPFFAMAFWGV